MPIAVEHERNGLIIEHAWTMDLLLSMSALVEEDGGPPMAHGSGYGIYADRSAIEHTFQCNYSLPDGIPILKGDRGRFWREGIGLPKPGWA